MVSRSEEFKKAAIQRFQNRGSKTVAEVCEDLGVSNSCIYSWIQKYAITSEMKTPRRPNDWSAQEKVQAVIEFENLEPGNQGEFLRSKGLHSDHIQQWKKAWTEALKNPSNSSITAQNRTEMSQLKAQNKALEKELNRKEKALAETAALLVLKKKANLLWGTGESE